MSSLSPQRKRVVLLCAAVACVGGGVVLFKGHSILTGAWIAVMVVMLVYAIAVFAKLKRQRL